MKKLIAITISIPLLALSTSAMSCDDKSCEKAYLSSTTQYIKNHGRQAGTARAEREAYAKNRERRDYALAYHLQRMHSK